MKELLKSVVGPLVIAVSIFGSTYMYMCWKDNKHERQVDIYVAAVMELFYQNYQEYPANEELYMAAFSEEIFDKIPFEVRADVLQKALKLSKNLEESR